jgi:hypothetical protein
MPKRLVTLLLLHDGRQRSRRNKLDVRIVRFDSNRTRSFTLPGHSRRRSNRRRSNGRNGRSRLFDLRNRTFVRFTTFFVVIRKLGNLNTAATRSTTGSTTLLVVRTPLRTITPLAITTAIVPVTVQDHTSRERAHILGTDVARTNNFTSTLNEEGVDIGRAVSLDTILCDTGRIVRNVRTRKGNGSTLKRI